MQLSVGVLPHPGPLPQGWYQLLAVMVNVLVGPAGIMTGEIAPPKPVAEATGLLQQALVSGLMTDCGRAPDRGDGHRLPNRHGFER